MRQLIKYAYTNAKVRAMLSFLIEPETLSRLAETKDVTELREALKKTPYKEAMDRLENSLDLGAVELELFRFDLRVYEKLHGVLTTRTEKAFLSLLKQRYELEEVKLALRAWHSKAPIDLDAHLLGEKVSSDIDFKRIVSCQNIEEIVLLLDDTPYMKPLAKARQKFKEKGSLFYLEVSLDIDYYERLFECIEGFSSADRKIARKLIGIEVDIENINWLIRLRKYYSLGMGEILDWVIPGGDRIDKDRVRSFYVSNGLGKIVDGLAIGPYAGIRDLISQDACLLEKFLYEILLHEVRRALAGFPFTIGTVIGYLVLKRRETKTLISLFYAKGLGLKKEEIC